MKCGKILQDFEKSQMEKFSRKDIFDDFRVGDTVSVSIKIGERTQLYVGLCIAMRNRGFNSSFSVFKHSYGEGVDRVFPYYSPRITSVKVVKRGDVRRAKLYYMKERLGKSARIKEITSGYKMKLPLKK